MPESGCPPTASTATIGWLYFASFPGPKSSRILILVPASLNLEDSRLPFSPAKLATHSGFELLPAPRPLIIKTFSFSIPDYAGAGPAACRSTSLHRSSAWYATTIRSAIRAALRRDGTIRSGDYRAVLNVWVSPSGRVERSQFLTSTGDTRLDGAIINTMQNVTLDEAPPANLATARSMSGY